MPDGDLSDHISRRYPDHTPIQGGAHTAHSFGMSDVPGSGADGQCEEISTHPQIGDRVPGIPGELSLLTLGLPIQKDERRFNKRLKPSYSSSWCQYGTWPSLLGKPLPEQ